MLGKLHRKGHTHIAEAHQSQLFLSGNQSLINRVKLHILSPLYRSSYRWQKNRYYLISSI